MPRIALTTSSSMSVMPLSSRASRLPSARSISWVIDGLVDVGDPRSREVDYRGERETREGAVSGALLWCLGWVGGYESALQALAPPVAEVPLTLVTVATAAAGVLWVILVLPPPT